MIHCSFTATQLSNRRERPGYHCRNYAFKLCRYLNVGHLCALRRAIEKTLEPTTGNYYLACCLEMATRVTAKNLLNLLFSVQQLALGLLLLLLLWTGHPSRYLATVYLPGLPCLTPLSPSPLGGCFRSPVNENFCASAWMGTWISNKALGLLEQQ